MIAIDPISITGADQGVLVQLAAVSPAAQPAATSSTSNIAFGDLLQSGMKGVEEKIATADKLVRDFALDESVPIHQVTIALEEARMAVDLALQVRTRLVEAYREIMNTQL